MFQHLLTKNINKYWQNSFRMRPSMFCTEIRLKNPWKNYNFQEKTVKIDKWHVNYFRTGRGPHYILCIPGGFGTWMDFKYQLEGFDLEKFTLFCFDTPGFGKSKASERDFVKDLHYSDADTVQKLMKIIDIPKYSVLGWSYGATVALIHAATCPEAVDKLVVWGALSRLTQLDMEYFERMKNFPESALKMIETRVQELDKEKTAKELVKNLIDAYVLKYKPQNGDICTNLLKDIHCPTFILYGAKDQAVNNLHVTQLKAQIENSRTYIYPEGNHHLHIQYADDFNQRIQQFLLQSNDGHIKSVL